MKAKTRLFGAMLAPLAVAAFLAATTKVGQADIIDDPLHGFCANCNETNIGGVDVTLGVPNPPNNFTFTASPGPQTGELFLDILVPNNTTAPSSLTVSITGSPNVTASRVDTAFTSGFLADFLGFSGTSPANPIGAFLPATQTLQPSATGFFVFQADLGLRQLGNPSNSPAGPNLDVEQTLALGSTIVAFLNTNVTGGTQSGFVATAPSGQLFVVPGPAEGAGLPGLIAACGGLLALARRRRMQAA